MQVGLSRDLGIVREFAMTIERQLLFSFFSLFDYYFWSVNVLKLVIYLELKELQQTYQALVLDVQGLIESNRHLQPQLQPRLLTKTPMIPNFIYPWCRKIHD